MWRHQVRKVDQTNPPACDRGEGAGFTLIELLIVIVILGILAAVVVFGVSGISNRGESSACAADEHTLANATEAYFGDRKTLTIPSGGVGNDQYEMELVNAGFLHSVSELWDVDSAGQVTPQAGSFCV